MLTFPDVDSVLRTMQLQTLQNFGSNIYHDAGLTAFLCCHRIKWWRWPWTTLASMQELYSIVDSVWGLNLDTLTTRVGVSLTSLPLLGR